MKIKEIEALKKELLTGPNQDWMLYPALGSLIGGWDDTLHVSVYGVERVKVQNITFRALEHLVNIYRKMGGDTYKFASGSRIKLYVFDVGYYLEVKVGSHAAPPFDNKVFRFLIDKENGEYTLLGNPVVAVAYLSKDTHLGKSLSVNGQLYSVGGLLGEFYYATRTFDGFNYYDKKGIVFDGREIQFKTFFSNPNYYWSLLAWDLQGGTVVWDDYSVLFFDEDGIEKEFPFSIFLSEEEGEAKYFSLQSILEEWTDINQKI